MANIIDIKTHHPLKEAAEDEKREMRRNVQDYTSSDLCKQLNDYYTPKPHHVEKRIPYNISRIVQYIGNGLSIAIGMVLGYFIGDYMFSSIDYKVTEWITLGQLCAIAVPIAFLAVLEAMKVYKARSVFKGRLQHNSRYLRWSDYSKLAFVFALSLAFNAGGGFQSVQSVRGEAPIAQASVVDVEVKTAHLSNIVARQTSEIADIEKQQAERVKRGQDRMYKVDKDLIKRREALAANESALIAAVSHWDSHNIAAKGNTDADNLRRKQDHENKTAGYSWLFLGLFALGDIIVILCIRYQEVYKWNTITEMKAAQREITNDYNSITNDDVNDVIDEKKSNPDPVDVIVNVIEQGGVAYVECNGMRKTKTQIKNKLASLKHRKESGKIKAETYNKQWPIWSAMKVAMDNYLKESKKVG